jgi:hypothetical protein
MYQLKLRYNIMYTLSYLSKKFYYCLHVDKNY